MVGVIPSVRVSTVLTGVVRPFLVAVIFCWNFPAFMPILEAIADDVIRAIFISADSTRIYAPYDGGADLFCTDLTTLNAIRLALDSYLSPLPSGL